MNIYLISRLGQQLREQLHPRTLAQLEELLLEAKTRPDVLAGLLTVSQDAQRSLDEQQEAHFARLMEESDQQEIERHERAALLAGTRPADPETMGWGTDP